MQSPELEVKHGSLNYSQNGATAHKISPCLTLALLANNTASQVASALRKMKKMCMTRFGPKLKLMNAFCKKICLRVLLSNSPSLCAPSFLLLLM